MTETEKRALKRAIYSMLGDFGVGHDIFVAIEPLIEQMFHTRRMADEQIEDAVETRWARFKAGMDAP